MYQSTRRASKPERTRSPAENVDLGAAECDLIGASEDHKTTSGSLGRLRPPCQLQLANYSKSYRT
jgi:hypothetical protein